MSRRRLSARERWLVAFLPGSIVLIGSFVLPFGRAEIRSLERAISRAPSQAEHLDSVQQLARATAQLQAESDGIGTELQMYQALLSAQPEMIEGADQSGGSAAERFHRLDAWLTSHGLSILSIEAVESSQRQRRDDIARSWDVAFAGSWPQLERAMADQNGAPPGLRVDSLLMESPRGGTTLRMWIIRVSESHGGVR